MPNKFLFLFSLAFCRILAGTLNDYCKIKYTNTPCLGCDRASQCGETSDEFAYLTEEERNLILDKHNEYRSKVARGKYNQQHLQPCKDMHVLSWDKEVEFFAACHIKRCFFHHDTMRISLDGVEMGQNMFMQTDSKFVENKKKYLEWAVNDWFGEIQYLDHNNVQQVFKHYKTIKGKGATAHLTQMIWGESRYLGCAYIHYLQGKRHIYMVVCNYYPSGNVYGQPMYATGKPLCKVKNDRFAGLCGTIRNVSDDNYKPPIDLNRGRTRGTEALLSFPVLVLSFKHFL